MSSTQPPQDAVALITDLTHRYPDHDLCMVGRMPPGMRWCVEPDMIYMQADPSWAPAILDLREALAELDFHYDSEPDPPARPALVALSGDAADCPTTALRAVGGSR